MTPEERSQVARLAAHALHAQGGTNTAPARKAFMSRFEREVDPEGVLDPKERAKRAEHAKSAYFTTTPQTWVAGDHYHAFLRYEPA